MLSALLTKGILEGDGGIDVDFWALRLPAERGDIVAALDTLVLEGAIEARATWVCVCGAENASSAPECFDCECARSADQLVQRGYVRPSRERNRDPAAVFLIHGMNTLGDWQQSFAWRIQLLYGYSLPVFVFKFGQDYLSPLTRMSQLRRRDQLGAALREAQHDLGDAGRSQRCDVIAHSFGTLLLAHVLTSAEFADLKFGRIVLAGSIIPEYFAWREIVDTGRVEAVLNHRAVLDEWVGCAPWIFPGTGPSGCVGFAERGVVTEIASEGLGHSDYFAKRHFDRIIRLKWKPFLEGSPVVRSSAVQFDGSHLQEWALARRHWIGRLLLGGVLTLLLWGWKR